MRKRIVLGVIAGSILVLSGSTQVKADEKDVAVNGEVIDTYCYALMGAKGEGHRQCALDCAKKGIAVGLLDEKSGKVYVLLPNKDKTALPAEVIDKMGRNATITGHTYASGGSQFLTVESVK